MKQLFPGTQIQLTPLNPLPSAETPPAHAAVISFSPFYIVLKVVKH